MSGGFFRGTSADQDTRFSNKQAKLLKSQKFAPELDHLVDIAKVKMDVVKPWIATRVTELLGFEDEVLINFIYGLLDGKEINGKQVQIQLTGFMEKNTGKFMKELWLLLLSAQKNSSGVPQQFLDAKEEELRKKKEAEDEKNRKKKEEADRITHEIQKKKEAEQERNTKTDDEVDTTRSLKDASDPVSKHLHPRDTVARKEGEKESEERNGSRGKDRRSRSPLPADRAPSSERSSPRSISRSFSRSRSYSDDRNKSRSMSRSPPRRRSISPDRRYRSPRRRSISPRRRHSPRRPRSPIRRRSPYSRPRSVSRSLRRSPSPARRRSPSPARRRSPIRRRSPSPKWRKSRSPLRRRSPSPKRRRSPSPSRRRSPPPMRRRSPSPKRRRSPSPFERRLRRGSPIPRHRSPSPFRRRSPSPRRRSPSPLKRRSPTLRSPKQRRRSPMRSPRQGNRTRSPYRSRSPGYRSRRSLSRDQQAQTNGVGPRRNHDDYASERVRGKRSPVHHTPEREEVDHRPPITLRSPQREPRKQTDAHKRMPVLSRSPEKSISQSDSSPRTRRMVPMEDRRRTSSPSVSPVRKTRERVVRTDSGSPVRPREDPSSCASPEISREEEIRRARGDGGQRTVSPETRMKLSPDVDDKKISKGGEARVRTDNAELRRKDRDRKSEKASVRVEHPGSSTEHTTVLLEGSGPGRMERETLTLDSVGEQSFSKKRSRPNNFDGTVQGDEEGPNKSVKGADHNKRPAASDSDNEEKDKYRSEGLEKRKHKRSARHHMSSDDDASYDSQVDTRKEAKRKRKEEKRLRKEEKRRRREERHRKKEERRAGKLKAKLMDTVEPPSDIEKNQSDAGYVDGNVALRREFHPSDDIEEAETEQKKLEIELRKKALESLRAKKAMNP